MATSIMARAVAPSSPLAGRQVVSATIGCWYPPDIDSTDLVDVDFDCKSVRSDGLYLVEAIENGKVVWRGARRIQVIPRALLIDHTGDGEYQRIESVESIGFRVVAHVVEVYKPARRIAELAAALTSAGVATRARRAAPLEVF